MRTTLTCLLVVVCLSTFAFSTELSYLPQVADGTWAGGSMKTTFILFNPTDTTVTVTFKLTDDAGGKLEVTIPGLGTDDEFGPITLEPGQTRFFQTSGTGGLRVGAAAVESSTRIGVSAIFSLFDTADHFITEAGVGSSLPGTNFVLPVDATGQFNTGVAILVPGAAAAHIEFILTGADGSTVGTTSQTVPAGGHMARFAAGPGSLFPQAGNLRGTLEISSDQPVATVVLRQNGAPLTNTTLPVVSTDSTKTQFNISQVANGTDQGFSIRTTFIVFNYSSGAVNVNFVIRKPDGSAFPVTIQGGVAQNTSTFSRQLASGVAEFLQTDGTGPLSVGSAQITSDVPVGVAAIFTVFSGQTFLTEAGVGDATSRTDFTLPVDTTGSFNTGVAVFNPGDVPAQVTYRLLDEDGVRVDQVTGVLLPGRSQSAKFVTEHFAGRTNFRGSLSVSSTVALATVTLRLNGSPLSYTTLPVEGGAVLGRQPVPALLDQTRSPIAATTNTAVNATLPAGFKISGQVTGSLAVLTKVVARSGQNQFSADIAVLTSRYVVVVPAGTYQLSVCYLAESQIPPPGVPILRHHVAPDVVVTADVVRDITIPSVNLNTVSGTVSGLNQFPTGSTAALSLVTGDEDSGVTELLLTGGYTALLPNGTYTASLLLEPPGGHQSILSLFNIGTLTVNGPTNANFAAPAAVTLSGAVTRADAAGMPPGSFLTVDDTTLPASATGSGCVEQANASSGELATANGAYQLLVPRDRALKASVAYPLGAIGSILFPASGRDLPALTADRTEDFNIPAIPPLDVTISGRVTDGGGQGVAKVRVGAFSDQLVGVAGQLSFSGQTQTDGNGNYTMNVPAGSNYQLRFVPRRPAP